MTQSTESIPVQDKRRRARRQGFTLVEILAATAIMVVITGFVLYLTSNVLSSWSASSSALSGNYEAKIALDKLSQDIESAIIRRNGNEWFVIEESPDDVPGTLRFMFYASVPDRPGDGPGDVCAVFYRILFQNVFNQSRTDIGERDFAIYRTIANPSDTFNLALAEESPRDYWNLPTVESGLTQHLLSRDVAAIRIGATYDDNGGNRRVAEDIEQLIIGDEVFIRPRGTPGGTVRRILYLDISIGVLGDEGAQAYHRDPDLPGSPAEANAERIRAAIDRYGDWFTRRVEIRSTPL